MSCITDLVVLLNKPSVELHRALLLTDVGDKSKPNQFLHGVEDSAWGGGRFPQTTVYLAAVNYLDWDKLVELLRKHSADKDDVQVFYCSELNDKRRFEELEWWEEKA